MPPSMTCVAGRVAAVMLGVLASACQSVVRVRLHEPTEQGFIETHHTDAFGMAGATASNFCMRDGRDFWLHESVLTDAGEVCGSISGKAGTMCVPLSDIRFFLSSYDTTVYGITDAPPRDDTPSCREMADAAG